MAVCTLAEWSWGELQSGRPPGSPCPVCLPSAFPNISMENGEESGAQTCSVGILSPWWVCSQSCLFEVESRAQEPQLKTLIPGVALPQLPPHWGSQAVTASEKQHFPELGIPALAASQQVT